MNHCRDCRHFADFDCFRNAYPDPVTGRPVGTWARQERRWLESSDSAICGSQGKFFEPRPTLWRWIQSWFLEQKGTPDGR